MMLLLAALAIAGFVFVGGCKKDKPAAPPDEPKTEEPKEEPKEEPTEEPKEEPKEEAKEEASGDSVGVPECDEYIGKYTKCVSDHVPAAQKALMEKSLATMKDAWKKAAATPAGKSALAQACKTAMETAKKSMAAFKCEW
jgi:hypothetical protein